MLYIRWPRRREALCGFPAIWRRGAHLARLAHEADHYDRREFCRRVAEAIAPLPVEMTFLFDRDEKTDDLQQDGEELAARVLRKAPSRPAPLGDVLTGM
jgi:hypothetical protein